jgi:hypothetical protein
MIGPCDACGYSTELEEFSRDINCPEDKERGPLQLCELCANTASGNSIQYPHEDSGILRALCYVGNRLLDPRKEVTLQEALKKLSSWASEPHDIICRGFVQGDRCRHDRAKEAVVEITNAVEECRKLRKEDR